MNILFRNIHIVSPSDNINQKTDLLIENGIISSFGSVNKIPDETKIIEAENLTCIPGLFDMHVHFRDPGQTDKEDFQTGSKAAMNGGFTGVLIMPNTLPPIDNPKIIKYIQDKTSDYLIDVEISACATKKRYGNKLADIKKLFNNGAIAFTDDGSPVQNPDILMKLFEKISENHTLFAQHSEDIFLAQGGSMNKGKTSKFLNFKGIPAISESYMIARDLLLLQNFKDAKYHAQHISSWHSVEIIRTAKRKKANVTAEVCPQHFILTEDECIGGDTNMKMNPPLRTHNDLENIIEGLKDDTIDVICTDHAPHTEIEKSQSFQQAPFGIIGLETSIALTYTYLVKKKIITFEKMIEKMSINPRKILNLDSIMIKEGVQANLTILDLNKKWIIDPDKFLSKSKNTPFSGFEVQCQPYAVINKNKIFFSEL